MHVTIQPPAVTAIGNAAKDVGETILANVPKGIAEGHGPLGGARIHELQAKGALEQCLENWKVTGDSAQQTTTTVGNKFIQTVNIYVSSDDQSGGLFKAVHYGGNRPN